MINNSPDVVTVAYNTICDGSRMTGNPKCETGQMIMAMGITMLAMLAVGGMVMTVIQNLTLEVIDFSNC